MPNEESMRARMYTQRRRSQRVLLDEVVIVRGESPDRNPIEEETFTLVVNAHGALIVMAASVALGQNLELVNPKTKEAREGHVVYIGRPYAGITQVAIDFTRPAPEFWPISCPPDDWKILRP
jgi:hypothetical protein